MACVAWQAQAQQASSGSGQVNTPVVKGAVQAMPTANGQDVTKKGNTGVTLMPPDPAPITSTAPQFLPQPAPVQTVMPTVSAYGTPIYYGPNGQMSAQPVQMQMTQQQGQVMGQQGQPGVPTALPPLPQPSVVQQALTESGMFLTPTQIRELKKQAEEMGRAAAEEPTGRPPRSETRFVTYSMSPGSTPPVVRLYMGYPTSVVMVDSAGNPWPIENFVGGSKHIEIKRPLEKEDANSASLTITPLTPTGKFTHGGVTVYLKGHPIPISLTYVGGQPMVDQRLDVRVPMRGPNTSAPMSFGVGPAANPQLLSLLEGVAPTGAKSLVVPSRNAQAWSLGNGKMLVRTPLVIISPGYVAGMKSSDGTNVYEMEQVSELKAIYEGKIVSIGIDY
jgi:intracellular multiplication protein IcmK